jgi:chemotaxis protein MotB
MRRTGIGNQPEGENHERWLVSYADFVTLLFAFFVVLFASSQTDVAKVRAVSQSFTEAVDGDSTLRRIAEALRGQPVRSKKPASDPGDVAPEIPSPDALLKSSESLAASLGQDIHAGRISIAMETRGLVISLHQASFFPSGGDALLPEAIPSMHKIARVISGLPNQIRLEGHTDSRPISNTRFRNNWELSSARGIAVLQWLQSNYNFLPSRLAVVSYADTLPKVDNDSEANCALNRRVDITILNAYAATHEAASTRNGR